MAQSTLVAIVKDERPYLVEWVAYHRLIGFDRLVLYSNDCSDGTDDLLDRMQDLGLVEHVRWPSVAGLSPQQAAYRDALSRCATSWIMFLDADEFLNLNADETVDRFLARFDADVGAVAISWKLFGSSGQLWRGPQPVTQRFSGAAVPDHPLNRHIKTIARAASIDVAGVHHCTLKAGHYAAADGSPCTLEETAFAFPRHDVAQVNHYVLRSREEFEAKLKRGNANLPPEHWRKAKSRGPTYFEEHDRNEVKDRTIQRWLPALKAEMGRITSLL